MAELAAGVHGAVDGLIATAYTHFPSPAVIAGLTEDAARAMVTDYVYFTGSPEARAASMYQLDYADPEVVDVDNALANLTPSGEILSIGNQPSRAALPLITVPVLLVLAEGDLLFPPMLDGVDVAEAELALFTGTSDRSHYVVPRAGHTFMLHPNAPDTQEVIIDWLEPRFPACPVT